MPKRKVNVYFLSSMTGGTELLKAPRASHSREHFCFATHKTERKKNIFLVLVFLIFQGILTHATQFLRNKIVGKGGVNLSNFHDKASRIITLLITITMTMEDRYGNKG